MIGQPNPSSSAETTEPARSLERLQLLVGRVHGLDHTVSQSLFANRLAQLGGQRLAAMTSLALENSSIGHSAKIRRTPARFLYHWFPPTCKK